jgi:hypothetical protein
MWMRFASSSVSNQQRLSMKSPLAKLGLLSLVFVRCAALAADAPPGAATAPAAVTAPATAPAPAQTAPPAPTAPAAAATPALTTAAPAANAAPPAATAAPPAPAAADAPAPANNAPATAGDAPSAPADTSAPGDFKSMDQEVQGLKKEAIDLNKDLFVLEEELLFPANTQVAVFLSMDVGAFFALDSVTVKLDDKEVTNYLYTAREADALFKGGVHRVYLGNLKVGKHEIVAFFTGKGPNERDYRRGATVTFNKGVGAKYLELKISDKTPKHQPEFLVKDWE